MLTRTNPRARHRRQVVRQILLPFGLGLLLTAAAGVAVGLAGAASASIWADIGLVWLIALTMIGGVVVLAALAAAVGATVWLLRWIPPRASRLQAIAARIPAGVGRGADALVRPVILVRSAGTALSRLWRRGGL